MDGHEYGYSHDGVKDSIIRHGAGLGFSVGWVEQMAEIVASKVDKWASNRKFITEDDIRHRVIIELQPLNKDIAYAYENHDKII